MAHGAYHHLDMIPIPEEIPELGIEAVYLGIGVAWPFEMVGRLQ